MEPQRLTSRPVRLDLPEARLDADLTLPDPALGLVLFAHGSGSSRHSPRNRFVAQALNRAGLGTLLLDLLTPHEEQVDARTGQLRFDIAFLAERVVGAMAWAAEQPLLARLPLGLFGASTGAAAALVAAASAPQQVRAVVSRGGRPDLAGRALLKVQAPTLLIVGGADDVVLELNQEALRQLSAPAQLEVVPGATHLFEEPGTLERVAELAGAWFVQHLAGAELRGPAPGL